MKEFWDTRYTSDQFVYGTAPNGFFRSELDKLKAGQILLPGEGEGRNAIYAASKGWRVHAFDQSQAGAEKAQKLAAEKRVHIEYQVCGLQEYPFKSDSYDAVGLIYFHVDVSGRKYLHNQAIKALKPGGILILEAFHSSQLENSTGGPQSPEMLFHEATVQSDFKSLQVLELSQLQVDLDEGPFHQGEAEVIRFVGRKIQ